MNSICDPGHDRDEDEKAGVARVSNRPLGAVET